MLIGTSDVDESEQVSAVLHGMGCAPPPPLLRGVLWDAPRISAGDIDSGALAEARTSASASPWCVPGLDAERWCMAGAECPAPGLIRRRQCGRGCAGSPTRC